MTAAATLTLQRPSLTPFVSPQYVHLGEVNPERVVADLGYDPLNSQPRVCTDCPEGGFTPSDNLCVGLVVVVFDGDAVQGMTWNDGANCSKRQTQTSLHHPASSPVFGQVFAVSRLPHAFDLYQRNRLGGASLRPELLVRHLLPLDVWEREVCLWALASVACPLAGTVPAFALGVSCLYLPLRPFCFNFARDLPLRAASIRTRR